jgi:hypothetical protein
MYLDLNARSFYQFNKVLQDAKSIREHFIFKFNKKLEEEQEALHEQLEANPPIQDLDKAEDSTCLCFIKLVDNGKLIPKGEIVLDKTKPLDIKQMLVKACGHSNIELPGVVKLFYEPCSDNSIDLDHQLVNSETRQISINNPENLPCDFI